MNGMLGPALFLAPIRPRRTSVRRPAKVALAPWGSTAGVQGSSKSRPGTRRVFCLEEAALSQAYCDDFRALIGDRGLCVTELCTRRFRGRCWRLPPCLRTLIRAAFYPRSLSGGAISEWADARLPRGHRGGNRGVPGHEDDPGSLWRIRLAHGLSLAAAAGGNHRGVVQGAGPAVAAAVGRGTRCWADICVRAAPRIRPLRRRNVRDVPRSSRRSPGRMPELRPQPFRPPATRLSRIHPPVRLANRWLPRQGRGVSAQRAGRCLWRLPGLVGTGRPVPISGGRAGGLQARLHVAHRGRISRVGRSRMGMLRQESRARRSGGRAVHRPPPDRCDDRRLR